MNPQGSTTNNTLNRQVKEKCIFCKKDTEYNICKPIHMRYFYVEGCGQLCTACYISCFNTSTVDTFQNYLTE